MKTVRCALPGYDVLTDTDLDHYSLYADTDNVLIKRALTGSDTVPVAGGGGSTTHTIPHNLGYIPDFSVYANYTDIIGDTWKKLNNQFNGLSVPEAIASIDTTNLYVVNFQAATLPYSYDIFYDDMDQAGTPTIVESKGVFKVARPGKSVLSLNPNDHIVHSDLNNFKILKQATVNKSLVAGDNTIAHGMTLVTPYELDCYIKFPDGKTAICGNATTYSYDESKWVQVSIDATNVHIRASGTFTVDVTYIITGTATTGSLAVSGLGGIIRVAKSGKNVMTETNIENINFDSQTPTLKYYESNTWDMGTISAGTVKTIAHNLGYTPYFKTFINDLANVIFGSSNFCIAPYYWGRSTIPAPLKDIAAFAYVDSTNLYLKMYYQTNAGGTNTTPKWYYKLFRNKLNL